MEEIVELKSELKSQARKAKQGMAHGIEPEAARAGEPDILDTLKKEHEAVKRLLSKLDGSEAVEERRSLVRQITAALVPHTVAEEKVVYEMVVALPDRQAQVDGYEGALEHQWAAKTLERLGSLTDAGGAEHKATAKVLKDLVEHHIQEEEENIWRDVRKHCSHDDRARLDGEYVAEKRRVTVPETA